MRSWTSIHAGRAVRCAQWRGLVERLRA